MYCQDCGITLPDEANFCSHCGKNQKSNVPQPEPERYEICQTGYQVRQVPFFPFILFWPGKAVFIASAVCPKKGNYTAAESPSFPSYINPSYKNHVDFDRGDATLVSRRQEAFNGLTQKLIADGWEPVSQSEQARFQYNFRRAVR